MKVAIWSVTPTMKLQLPSDWRLDLSGTIGRSQTNIASRNYVTGAIASTTGGFYDNRIRAIELRGDGSLLALPGGNLGLAVGGGYRSEERRVGKEWSVRVNLGGRRNIKKKKKKKE